jgi:hypothetical protein
LEGVNNWRLADNHISQIDQDSPFLKLSGGQVRNEIKAHYFASATYVVAFKELNDREPKGHFVLECPKNAAVASHIALLQACHQTRNETAALPLIYGTLKLKSLRALADLDRCFVLEELSAVTSLHLETRCIDRLNKHNCFDSRDWLIARFVALYHQSQASFADLLPGVKHVIIDFIDVRPEDMPALGPCPGSFPFPKTGSRARMDEWIKRGGKVDMEGNDFVVFISDEEPFSIIIIQL